MSSGKEHMAADLRGPLNYPVVALAAANKRAVVAIVSGDTATHAYDLSSSGYFNSSEYQDRFVRIVSETGGDIWYFWTNNAADTVDKTSTTNTGGTVGAYLPSKVYSDECPTGQYLVLQMASAGIVRMWLTSGPN